MPGPDFFRIAVGVIFIAGIDQGNHLGNAAAEVVVKQCRTKIRILAVCGHIPSIAKIYFHIKTRINGNNQNDSKGYEH